MRRVLLAVRSSRQATFDGPDGRQMLLVLVVFLHLFLERCRILGADQGIGRALLFGPEVQVALVIANLVREVIAPFLPDAESVGRLARVLEELLQLGTLRT